MREDRFDDKIRELLNQAHEDYDITSWDRLSDRLDHETSDINETNTDDFIPVLKEKLSNQRATVNEDHWDSLKSDLDYIEARRDRLYIIKALEAAIVLLLLFTYFNYKWLSNDVQMDIAYMENVEEQAQKLEYISAELYSHESLSKDILQSSKRVFNRKSIAPIQPLSPNSFLANSLEKTLQDGFSNSGNGIFKAPVTTDQSFFVGIEKTAINPFVIEHKEFDHPEYASLSADKIDNNNSDGWRLGLPISYDINFINTDLNLGYLSNQIQSGLGGKSMGISIAYKKGNYELESGIRYAEKTFVPGLLTNYSKSGANSFLESQLDHMVIKQIQIPLLAKIYAAPSRKSTLYGMVGLAFNSIIENEYAISRTVLPKARFANAPTSDLVNLKALPQGIANGGSLGDNIYVSGVIGIGIQSYIVEDVSWYLQPQYQHSFTSNINEIVNKVNSLSIEGGFKFSF